MNNKESEEVSATQQNYFWNKTNMQTPNNKINKLTHNLKIKLIFPTTTIQLMRNISSSFGKYENLKESEGHRKILENINFKKRKLNVEDKCQINRFL